MLTKSISALMLSLQSPRLLRRLKFGPAVGGIPPLILHHANGLGVIVALDTVGIVPNPGLGFGGSRDGPGLGDSDPRDRDAENGDNPHWLKLELKKLIHYSPRLSLRSSADMPLRFLMSIPFSDSPQP